MKSRFAAGTSPRRKPGSRTRKSQWIPAYNRRNDGLRVLSTIAGLLMTSFPLNLKAVEIPLDATASARIGYIDLQKVFDSYPEKSFAEGDLLREIEKRKRELGQRQNQINLLRQQIAADETTLTQAKAGQAVMVPPNSIPEPPPPTAPAPATPAAPTASTGTTAGKYPPASAVEPYPMEDPLAGLPGHELPSAIAEQTKAATTLPGMKETTKPQTTVLDLLASATGPVQLNTEAIQALQKRVETNKRALERNVLEFKNFRSNAVGDMKVLQTQKTYGVMSKIYAVLQGLAREEGVSVVLDKAYVLYGEDTVDLSEKLIARLQAESGL
jgi:Skp family chaperone for outer membrane proteins